MESLEDLRNNWNRLIDVAGLTPEERREGEGLDRAGNRIVLTGRPVTASDQHSDCNSSLRTGVALYLRHPRL
jgi:hypothetical protein